jgi:hypothetical protein
MGVGLSESWGFLRRYVPELIEQFTPQVARAAAFVAEEDWLMSFVPALQLMQRGDYVAAGNRSAMGVGSPRHRSSAPTTEKLPNPCNGARVEGRLQALGLVGYSQQLRSFPIVAQFT